MSSKRCVSFGWRALPAVALLLHLAAAAPVQGAESRTPPSGPAASVWQTQLQSDLAFIRDTLQSRYIYAVYPGGSEWQATFDPAMRRAVEAATSVVDFAGYRAVLNRLASEFLDPHLRVTFNLQPARLRWPGLSVRLVNGRYQVAVSRVGGIVLGAEISTCDGRSLDEWLDQLALLEGGIPGSEASRTALAPRLLTDTGNPFWALPQACVIGGVETSLEWVTIAADAWATAIAPTFAGEPPPGLSRFAERGAWIRLPSMTPRTQAQADAYHDVIRRAPELRHDDVIVFDVRGNGGGSYNWFMAILNSLYGYDFASYFARERLRITPVFVTGSYQAPAPANGTNPATDAPSADPYATPPDIDLERVIDHVRSRRLTSGVEVTIVDAADDRRRARPRTPPPPNPVRAKVYVLTDAGCGSSCVSFVDEMLQLPGVTQVGGPTSVDRRSGSPVAYPLPSGLATLLVPSMVRDDRARGENQPRLPAVRFPGDLADTGAVQEWILGMVSQAAPGVPSVAVPTAAAAAPVVSRHSGVFGGERVTFDAIFEETIVADSKGAPAAIMTSFSYISRPARPDPARPVLFAFNGGPGSASIWLHMGLLGPRRVVLADAVHPPTAPPFQLQDNVHSLLDVADVVLIDPVLTGYSRLLPGGKAEEFLGTRQDARAFADFIRQWLTRHERWNSPKFVAGESFGTTRAIAMAEALLGGVQPPHGSLGAITLNGIITLGPLLARFSPEFAGNDREYLSDLPTMAATAWYHGRLASDVATVQAATAAAQAFARSEYLRALDAGYRLEPAEQQRIAARLGELTGLPAAEWLEANLRMSDSAFRSLLLRDRGLEVGTFDSRFTLPARASGADPVVDDPAMGQYTPAFVGALHEYMSRDLGLHRAERYVAIAFAEVNFRWDYGSGPGIPVARNDATGLATAMRRNPELRVFVGAGYFDFATTLGAAEYALDHAAVDRERLTIKGYASGHMPYLGEESASLLAADLRHFVRSAVRPAAL